MNKWVGLGRLVRDPEVRYSQGNEPICIAKYTLAVDRRFKKQGEQSTDFIPCVAFGKVAEFAEKYLSKGQLIVAVGRIQVRNWEDKDHNKRVTTEVVVEEQYFAESKKQAKETASEDDVFVPADENDDLLPF